MKNGNNIVITNLLNHKTKNNENLINYLIYIIKEANIKTLDELQQLENLHFSIDGALLNYKKRIDSAYNKIINSITEYELYYLEKLRIINELKEKITKKISDEEKIYYLIKLNDITDRDCLFLVEAYNLIINNKY